MVPCLFIESGIARSDENSIRFDVIMSDSFEIPIDLDVLRKQADSFQQEESARRVRALEFVRNVFEILHPVANKVFTSNDVELKTFSLAKSKVYFRWKRSFRGTEEPGFYLNTLAAGSNLLGEPLESVDGTRFWDAIRTIIDWLPEVAKLFETKDESREQLLSLLRV